MEYPKTLRQAMVYFDCEERAEQVAAAILWPEGMGCAHCKSKDIHYMKKYRRWRCRTCRGQFTVRKGTLMENSNLPIKTWMCAIWMFVSGWNGVSSRELSRELGVSKETAWYLEHRIRAALAEANLPKLSNTVEMDETFVGGKNKNRSSKKRKLQEGRGPKGKITIVGIKQRNGRVMTKVIEKRTRKVLHKEIHDNVEPGSTLYTDSFRSYEQLKGYHHDTVNHDAKEYVRGDVHTNSIENVWSHYKRRIYGTYVGFSRKHLQRYSAENDFRHNSHGLPNAKRFENVVAGMAGKRLTYKELTATTGANNDGENKKVPKRKKRKTD